MNVSKESIPSQASVGTQEHPLHDSASTLSPYTEACGLSGPKFPGTQTTLDVKILLGQVTTSFLGRLAPSQFLEAIVDKVPQICPRPVSSSCCLPLVKGTGTK